MLRRLKEDVARDLPTKTLEPLDLDASKTGFTNGGDELTEEQHRVYAGIQAQHEMDVARGGGPQAIACNRSWQI